MADMLYCDIIVKTKKDDTLNFLFIADSSFYSERDLRCLEMIDTVCGILVKLLGIQNYY